MLTLNEIAFKNARARFTASNGSVVQVLADYMLEVHYAADVAWNALAEMDTSPTVHFAMASIGSLILPAPAEEAPAGDCYTQRIRDLARMAHVSPELSDVLTDCADNIDKLNRELEARDSAAEDERSYSPWVEERHEILKDGKPWNFKDQLQAAYDAGYDVGFSHGSHSTRFHPPESADVRVAAAKQQYAQQAADVQMDARFYGRTRSDLPIGTIVPSDPRVRF